MGFNKYKSSSILSFKRKEDYNIIIAKFTNQSNLNNTLHIQITLLEFIKLSEDNNNVIQLIYYDNELNRTNDILTKIKPEIMDKIYLKHQDKIIAHDLIKNMGQEYKLIKQYRINLYYSDLNIIYV